MEQTQMRFEKLNEIIPYVVGGKPKILSATICTGVSIAQPGRHAAETKGGDAVVMVSDEQKDWTNHQFTHDDIFTDIEEKFIANPEETIALMKCYKEIVCGA